MSIATQALKYGWVALASLTITGTTIFIVDNHVTRINTATRMEIILGTVERCLATQTGTNELGEPVYGVDPPEIVSSWYSNSYAATVTNGVTNWTAVVWTQIVTNAIGWLDDPAVKDQFDAKIQELVPYYINTNCLYAGSTNIYMWTVTGLWAELEIGNRTNLFTAVPAEYTTNGVATYGAWPWRNYIEDWYERYKVLNALKSKSLLSYVGTNFFSPTVRDVVVKGNIPGSGGYGLFYQYMLDPLTNRIGDANNTEYTVRLDNRNLGYVWPGYGIDMGLAKGDPAYNLPQDDSLAFAYDYPEGEDGVTYSSSITFNTNVEVYTVGWFHSFPDQTYTATLTDKTIALTATLGPPGSQTTCGYNFWPVLAFPFVYCTNRFW